MNFLQYLMITMTIIGSIAIISIINNFDDNNNNKEINLNNTVNTTLNISVQEFSNDFIEVHMCRDESCKEVLSRLINQSNTSIHCAFFDFDLKEINLILKEKKIEKKVYVDGDNKFFNESYIIYENKSSYMHNKICIFDSEITVTGSFNPTFNDEIKNDNNLVVIKSRKLSDIYEKYFNSLVEEYNSKYKNRSKINRDYSIEINNSNISICFSRGGKCNDLIIKELEKANDSIKFMLFSLTEDSIADALIFLSSLGIRVEGIMEKSLISTYSSIHKLNFHDLSIKKDCSPGKLHHKVFIIDTNTVITGSFNPGDNADDSNDENMLVIHNQDIAVKYLKEFNRTYYACNNET